MAYTAGDALMDILIKWGVDTIFGLPGDGVNGVIEALRKRQDKIKFVQVRHEEAAAFMACGYAKFTGRLGVCLSTSGPGGIHLLNGLYDAKFDGAPVLAITGMHFHDLLNTHAQQDVELDKLFQDVAVYNARVMGPDHLPNVAELACRKALSARGVAHITIPVDFQSMECSSGTPSERNVPYKPSATMPRLAHIPDKEDLDRGASVLNQGRKIAILAGQGALDAREELLALAEKLGAPIVKSLLGKGCVPDDSIYTTGGIGLLGTAASQLAMEECDTLLMVGTSFPYLEYFPKPGQARCVQIDVNPDRISLRHPAEVGLVGDSKKTLQALLPLVQYNQNREFLYTAQERMQEWWKLMKNQGERTEMPMKPQVVAWELGKRLSPDAIVSSDSGTITTWFARQIPARGNQMFSVSGTLATMACGLPYAIAAQAAYPGRQVIAFVGDGGFSMLMADFVTAVKHRLPVKIVVIKNNTLGQIKWEQMVFLGNPEYGCDLAPIDFVKFAEACGGHGYRIEDPRECGEILTRALNDPYPCVIEAVVDPLEPPMPGKIKLEQAIKFAEALARGEPNRAKIAMTVLSDKVKESI